MRNGLFGLGEVEDDKPICRYFKEQATVAFAGNEVIISEALCQEQMKKEERPEVQLYPEPKPEIPLEIGEKKDESGFQVKSRDKVQLHFGVPKGKVSGIMGVMNLLQSKFETLKIELIARDGTISEQDYEDKIEEAFRQLGIELNEE